MGSAIIEVGIGLILVFIVLSIILTQLNDFIANVMNLRAEHLRETIQKLVDDVSITRAVLQHPLVRVAQQQNAPTRQTERARYYLVKRVGRALLRLLVPDLQTYKPENRNRDLITTRVTYVEPSQFAEAMLDVLLPRSVEQRHEITAQAQQAATEAAASTPDAASPTPATPATPTAVTDQVRQLVENPRFDERLRETLRTVLSPASSYEDMRARIEAWFRGANDADAALFKQRIQRIAFLIGALLTVLLNVDALHVARTLWNDPVLREAVIIAADQQLTAGAPATPDPNAPADVPGTITNTQQRVDDLLALRLPIGWTLTRMTATTETFDTVPGDDPRYLWALLNPLETSFGNWLWLLVRKLGAWLITVFAIIQGSDFWFNLLRQLRS